MRPEFEIYRHILFCAGHFEYALEFYTFLFFHYSCIVLDTCAFAWFQKKSYVRILNVYSTEAERIKLYFGIEFYDNFASTDVQYLYVCRISKKEGEFYNSTNDCL